METKTSAIEMPAVVEDDMFADLLPQVGGASATRLTPIVDEKNLAQEMPMVVEAKAPSVRKEKRLPLSLNLEPTSEEISGKTMKELHPVDGKVLKNITKPEFVNFANYTYQTPDSDELLKMGIVSVDEEMVLFSELPDANALFLEVQIKRTLYKLPSNLETEDLVELSPTEAEKLKMKEKSYSPLRYYFVKDVKKEEQDTFVEDFSKVQTNKKRGVEQ